MSMVPRGRLAIASVSIVAMAACGAPRAVSNRVSQDQVNDVALTSLSSGFVGCPPEEITVADYRYVTFERDVDQSPSSETWTARCRGEVFHCSHSSVAYSCARALPTDRPAP